MDIQTILSQIDLGSYALPEFQRGYVWNRDQVKKLMNSLYRSYPIGSLLVWVTPTNPEITKGTGPIAQGSVNLILDGQQRITSLYGIIRGKEPMFFDGNKNAFTGLYFNLQDETFEFYAPLKMKDNPFWINVTQLMQVGIGNYVQDALKQDPEKNKFLYGEFEKLNKIDNIKKIDLHIHQVAGSDKTIDVVVEIFNNVNSGGTKLSKGDLALAKICAEWPEARNEMKKILSKLAEANYRFELEWLLRCITVYLTGKAYFSELAEVPINDFKKALIETKKLIGSILDHIGSILGLDHERVLGSRYSIPLMVRMLKNGGGKLASSKEWNKLMFWYIHTFLWGRYAGSTESVLAQDLNIIESGEGIDGLIHQIRQNRGDLTLKPDDFWGWSTGSRFYPLLYLLTRTNHSLDWGTGVELSNSLLGKNSSLDIHHIFPKDLLYKNGYSKSIVNALANYSFLTKDTNLEISNKPPKEYIPEYRAKNPGAIESHWIPTEPAYFEIEKYEDFLKKRRELLAASANKFLNSLLTKSETNINIENFSDRKMPGTSPYIEAEEDIVLNIGIWMEESGLPSGEINYPIIDEKGYELVMIDLAWPNGIQTELSEPIALMMNESEDSCNIANQKGYRVFTDPDKFKQYVYDNHMQNFEGNGHHF